MTADPGRTAASSAAAYADRLLSLLGITDLAINDFDDAGETVEWERSGASVLTGRADGPPLRPASPVATATRGALLAVRALTAALGGEPDVVPDTTVLSERATYAGFTRQGPTSAGGSMRIVECGDGWVAINLARPEDVASVPAVIGDDIDGDPWLALEKWCRGTTATAAADRAQLLGIAAAAVTEALPPPATPYRCHAPRQVARQTHPLVVDFSALWAGPLCARLLGLAGARIVKVESTERPDGARSGPARFYQLLHDGHESKTFDFHGESDLQRLRDLVAAADIVIEASRPRALAALGIGPTLAPEAIWLSITAYDRAGPWADRLGFGDDTALAGGLVAWDGDVPMPVADAVADPLTGVHAAVAVLASWYAGTARRIDVNLRDVAAYVAASPFGAGT